MSVTFDVRTATKDLIVANLIQPVNPVGILTVFVSPEDDKDSGVGIELDTFPTIIIQKGLYNRTDSWKKVSQSLTEYTFWNEVIVYLAEEKYPDGDAQSLMEDWQTAIVAVLAPEPTLNGSCIRIETSDSGEFLFSRDGYFDWYTQDNRNKTSYWGVSFTMRVTIEVDYLENVGVSP